MGGPKAADEDSRLALAALSSSRSCSFLSEDSGISNGTRIEPIPKATERLKSLKQLVSVNPPRAADEDGDEDGEYGERPYGIASSASSSSSPQKRPRDVGMAMFAAAAKRNKAPNSSSGKPGSQSGLRDSDRAVRDLVKRIELQMAQSRSQAIPPPYRGYNASASSPAAAAASSSPAAGDEDGAAAAAAASSPAAGDEDGAAAAAAASSSPAAGDEDGDEDGHHQRQQQRQQAEAEAQPQQQPASSSGSISNIFTPEVEEAGSDVCGPAAAAPSSVADEAAAERSGVKEQVAEAQERRAWESASQSAPSLPQPSRPQPQPPVVHRQKWLDRRRRQRAYELLKLSGLSTTERSASRSAVHTRHTEQRLAEWKEIRRHNEKILVVQPKKAAKKAGKKAAKKAGKKKAQADAEKAKAQRQQPQPLSSLSRVSLVSC